MLLACAEHTRGTCGRAPLNGSLPAHPPPCHMPLPDCSLNKEHTWRPFDQVALPPKLAFATWWNEGKECVHMHVTYDTATRKCQAG